MLALERVLRAGGVTPKRARHAGLQTQPVAHIVEADGVGELGEEHRREMAQDAEGAGLGLHARLAGVAVDHSARNEVENLLEDDHIGCGLVLFCS